MMCFIKKSCFSCKKTLKNRLKYHKNGRKYKKTYYKNKEKRTFVLTNVKMVI